MTSLAVMVVPFVIPSTRTLPPFVTALAELKRVRFQKVVEDASRTVTFWPVAVVSVKPEVETLSTVPIEPPAAGPDRALDPPRRGTPRPDTAGTELAAGGAPEPVLAVALTMP
jgi:hypothetical protein